MSWLRPIAGLLGLLILVTVTLWLRVPASPALSMAGALQGTRLFRLNLQDERIGTFETTLERTSVSVRSNSRLDAALPGGDPFSVIQHYEFATTPPYRLLRADHTTSNGPRAQTITLTREGEGYHADIVRSGVHEQQQLQWQYTLTDHLGLELWLRANQPHAAARKRVRALDFDRLRPVRHAYSVVQQGTDGGYVLSSAAPLDDKLVFLDATLRPYAMSIAGLFTLTLAAPGARAEPNRTSTQAPYTRVALAAPIARHTDVRRLTLGLNQAAATALTPLPGMEILMTDTIWVLHSDPGNPQPAASDPLIGAGRESLALALPDNDPRLMELLERALRQARGTTDPLVALAQFVNGYLVYDEASHSLGLADTLATRRGDCTEFADLLTALARSAGYSAKTVTGLAYSDVHGPGFYLHAWTEIDDGTRTRGFDPTWNQTRLDATHLPFADTDVEYLRAYAALPNMRFEVRAVEYF